MRSLLNKYLPLKKVRLTVLALCAINLPALAHPGHDHHASTAWLIHLLWLLPAIFIAIMLLSFIGKQFFSHQKQKDSGD